MEAGVKIEIPVISWLDEPVRKSVNSVFGGINAAVEAFDLFNKYRGSHFSMLNEAVGKVKVLGMSSPLSLIDLYYPTYVSSDIRRRLYQPEWRTLVSDGSIKSGVNKFRSIDGADYVEKSKRLVVLGGPGAGKTTFLKFLALAYSNKGIFESTKLKTQKLPFFLPLPDFSKSEDSVLGAISAALVVREGEYARDFVERAVKKGLAVILMDSLDEVPEDRRPSVVGRIKEFCNIYPDVKIVISCRAADYKEVLESFDEVELVKLGKSAVKAIVRSWFKGRRDLSDKLISVIESDSGISNLTETPLLLSLLCIQFKHDLILPRRKVEVYKRCVETLLRDWDATRGFRRESSYESLSDLHKERLFEHIAGRATDDGQVYIFSDERICEIAGGYVSRLGLEASDAREIILEIERHHGIVERHSLESFCFSHASIQDYFVARDAISRRSEMDLIRRRLDDESWSGVIEFICGLHPEPDSIFDLMIKRATLKDLKNYPAIERRAKLLYLVYRCMSVGPILPKEKALEINSHIVRSLQSFVSLMGDSGVYPMCAYGEGGVRHPYFHTGSKRPSLHSALLPYRKLSNEILVRPVAGYAEIAIESCDEILARTNFSVVELSLVLNTVVPLSKLDPDSVLVVLAKARQRLEAVKVFVDFIDETIRTITKRQALEA